MYVDVKRFANRDTGIFEALKALRAARNLLVLNGAPKAADKVRKALKSAEGALRHAQGERFGGEGGPPYDAATATGMYDHY